MLQFFGQQTFIYNLFLLILISVTENIAMPNVTANES